MIGKILSGVAALACASLLVTGCAGITIGAPTVAADSSAQESFSAEITAEPTVAPSMEPGMVAIILPDSTPGSRWDKAGQQILRDAFEAAGVPVTIQNAEGDPAAFVTIAEDMGNQGVSALVIVNLDAASGMEAIAVANGLGVLAVDYDRLTPNGGAQYFVGIADAKEGDPVTAATAKAEAEALALFTQALTSDDPSAADALAVDFVPDPEAGYDVASLLVTP